MNKKIIKHILFIFLAVLILIPYTAKADIVYPARLELREVQPGIYEVYFVLPVINGKVLKAVPNFPEFCQSLEEPRISGNAFIKQLRWRIQCEPGQLYGQNIGIDGLLGSQIDIILEISTLEGRTYNTTLSPASAYFKVPYPPTWKELAGEGLLTGLRKPVTNMVFALFLFILVLKRYVLFPRNFLPLFLGLSIGYILAYFEWLRTPGWSFEIFTLLLAFSLVAEDYVTARKLYSGKLLFPLLMLASILFVADKPGGSLISGFTAAEEGGLILWTITGMILGTLLLFLLFKQGLIIINNLAKQENNAADTLYIVSGILALGLLIYHSSLFWTTPSLFPTIPYALWVMTLIIVMIYFTSPSPEKYISPLWIFISYLLGLGIGFSGWHLPFITEIALAAGAIVVVLNVLRAADRETIVIPLLVITGFGAGQFMAGYTNENLSYALARSLEFSCILIFIVLLIAPLLTRFRVRSEKMHFHHTITRVLLVITSLAFVVVLLRRADIHFNSMESNPQLYLPLLSIALLLAAVVLWPRQKKIHKDMGIKVQKPVAAVVCLVLAIGFLPVRTHISNPAFDPANMDQEQVKMVMQQVLSDTYTAFNIEDEERLFEALSSRVDDQLLDNIYLDSRRRLTMGLREGAEVTVEDVRVENLGMPENVTPASTYSYPTSWTVTARVKHLKHIHYRRNRYTGTIELKTDKDLWKISKIILNSEEREVIPSTTL